MNRKDQNANLIEILDQLGEAAGHLKVSLDRCKAISSHTKKENVLIEFEALSSRFSRATDILIHKVYRSIDAVEFVEGGTLIDVMNRADKRKLIDSIQEMRVLKDLRNDIAHEYISERIQLLHEEILDRTPKVLQLIARAIEYCQRYR